jgi:predicted glutamine amidotransferase
MCRWVAYSGNAIRPAELLIDTPHSLVEQSRRDRLAGGYPNADGFGLGWYGDRDVPGLYRSVAPAWGDRNLSEIATQISTRLFLAHIRAATGTPVEQTNCHPFRHGRWLFMHNGFVEGYKRLRRDLLLAVDPRYFDGIEGTTDSEVIFHLALTFGLEEDPLAGLERMAGFVEDIGHGAGIAEPLQMTVAVSDGERVWAVRYASGPVVNSLFVSADAGAVREMHPEDARFRGFADHARAIVSEPLSDLPGVWHEIPPGTAYVIQPGEDLRVPFRPRHGASPGTGEGSAAARA